MEPGYHTRHEILSQPEAWASALTSLREQTDGLLEFYRAGQYQSLLFTGCGSAHYLGLSAAAVMQALAHVPACGVPASEIWLNPAGAYVPGRKALLVAVSRSGETTETVRACEAFQARGGDALTLSCYPGHALTRLGQINIVLPQGQEESFAQTRAFTTLYLAAVALAAVWAERADLIDELERLPALCQALSTTYQRLETLGSDSSLDRFYFLGSGLRYGLACELSLKMKEMSLSHSEPFHFLEFRHGPKSMVTPSTLMIGLVSESSRDHELAVLNDVRALGARVLAVGEQAGDVVFASGLSEVAHSLLYLPVGQQLAFGRALFKGLNPDRPNNLQPVILLDGGQ